jgi:hypothetical protein
MYENESPRATALRKEATYNLAYSRAVIDHSTEHDSDVRRARALIQCEGEYAEFIEAQALLADSEYATELSVKRAQEMIAEVHQAALDREKRWDKELGRRAS